MTNPLVQRQVVATMALEPSLMQQYPQIQDILLDGVAKSVYSALKAGVPTNPVALAEGASKHSTVVFTPDEIKSMLSLATDYGPVDVPASIVMLQVDAMKVKGINVMREMLQKYEDGKADMAEAAGRLMQLANNQMQMETSLMVSTSDWELWGEEQARLRKQRHAEKKYLTLPPAFPVMQKYISSIMPGSISSLLAKPGAGKTSVSQEVAHWWGRSTGEPVAYFSLELSDEEMMWRWMCHQTKYTMSELEAGYWPDEVKAAAKAAKDDKVMYIEAIGWTPDQIVAWLQSHGNPHAIIDYFALLNLKDETKGATEARQIEEALGKLKTWAGRAKRGIWINWQTTKEGLQKPYLHASDAAASAAPLTRSNLFLVANSPIAEEDTKILDPFTGNYIEIAAGTWLPLLEVTVEKYTKGDRNGPRQYWWGPGAHFQMRDLPSAKREYYIEFFKNMRKQALAAKKK